MRKIVFALLLLCGCKAHSPNNGMLLNEEFVDLKGKKATTIIVNETPDTLKLGYRFFNWLPYVETQGSLIIAPGSKDTLELTFNFPDKISINGGVFIYNSPGKTLICRIKEYRSKNIKVDFEGSLAQENDYYLAYQQFLKNHDNESRSYYTISDTLSDWNRFPTIGDSITRVRQDFLANYNKPLPDWFKPHESRRLKYNNYCRLLNALFAKQYHSGKNIKVDDSYYAFEKELNKEDDMILNDTYLYCMGDYFGRIARIEKKPDRSSVIDSLYHQTDIGDVNMMRHLGLIYKNDKLTYDKLISVVKFKQPERKIWLNEAIQNSNPVINKRAPAIQMVDIKGKSVKLADYNGKMVIVNFWATWCMPCIEEFPYENKIYQQYKDGGLVVINICCDSKITDWKRISKRENLQMVNLYTNKASFKKLLGQYNLGSLPKSILINRQGIVVNNAFKHASKLSTADIDQLLN